MAKGIRYSFANYILTVSVPTEISASLGVSTISFGGEGSYIGSISISRTADLWSTSGDSTGGWIHTKSLNAVGTVTLDINPLAEKSQILKTLFNIYRTIQSEVEGMTMTLTDMNNKVIAIAEDCMIQNIPNIDFGETLTNQSWQFTCGKVEIM